MASVATDGKSGRRVVQFAGADGKRRSLRLGRVTKRDGETAGRHVEQLVASKLSGGAIPSDTAEWLGGLPEKLYRVLHRGGLVQPRRSVEQVEYCRWGERYIAGRPDVKALTLVNYRQALRLSQPYLGGKLLSEITPADAERVLSELRKAGYAEGYIRRRLGIVRQFLTHAVRSRLIESNPFEGLKLGDIANRARDYFVSVDQINQVLAACPDAEWRLIVVLARYGALRCPSELRALRWADVNWEKMLLTVRASKTAHHADGGIRLVPIFPEIEPDLLACYEPGEGLEFVLVHHRGENLRTQLERIVGRAGVKPWPKLFQNMRATRATEIERQFGGHLATEWCGHSLRVAFKHYYQATDADFAKAVQWRTAAVQQVVQDPVQQVLAQRGRASQELFIGEMLSGGTATAATACKTPRNDAAWHTPSQYARLDSNQQPSVP